MKTPPFHYRKLRTSSGGNSFVNPAHPSVRQAFSLVEVVMALAIISLSAITMLGLIPVGLVSLRHSTDSTTEGEIVKQLTSQIRLTPFSQLSAQSSFFYDEQGGYLTNGASLASAPAGTRYCVTAIQSAPVYPSSSNAPGVSPVANSIKMITLQFVSGAGSSAAALSTNKYVVLVPNSGS